MPGTVLGAFPAPPRESSEQPRKMGVVALVLSMRKLGLTNWQQRKLPTQPRLNPKCTFVAQKPTCLLEDRRWWSGKENTAPLPPLGLPLPASRGPSCPCPRGRAPVLPESAPETRAICVQGLCPQSHSRHQGVTRPAALQQKCPVSPSMKCDPRGFDPRGRWAAGEAGGQGPGLPGRIVNPLGAGLSASQS